MKNSNKKEEVARKINDTKFNRILKMRKLVYNTIIDENELLNELKICQKTLKEWKKRMEQLAQIEKITIDRALKEMIFTQKCQIECFEFLKKDLNFFATYEEVKEKIKISRYLYIVVKKYIKEELAK